MKLLKSVLIFCIAGIAVVGIISCDNGSGSNTTTTDPAAAEAYLEDARTALEEGDFDGALSNYSSAVSADPTNGEALLGYAMMETMDITVDPDMVTLAQNNLGLVNYPSTMNELFSDSWLTYYTSSEVVGFEEFYAPEISGEGEWADFSSDPDNPTDVVMNEEKALAELSYFVKHNNGFNEVVDGMSGVLEDRIQSALNAIDSIPSDAQIVLPGELTGNMDNQSNYQDIVLGKAEVNIVAAYLLSFRSQVRMGQVYDYSLPNMEDYYNNILLPIIDGDAGTSPTYDDPTPFSGSFLQASTDAQEKLNAAKGDMRAMISRLKSSITTIKSRTGSTFSLSSGSDLVVDQDASNNDVLISDIWESEIEVPLDFADTLFTKIDSSIAAGGGIVAHLPIYDDYSSDYANELEWMNNCLTSWPTSGPPESVGIDFGAYYADPLFAINVIFDLNADGEPVFYQWDNSGGFEAVSTYTADTFYYIKVNDMSFGGTIDTGMFPLDAKGTEPYALEEYDFDWSDDDDGYWSSDEEIYDHGIYADISGLIDINNWTGVEEPAEYYWSPIDFSSAAGEISDSELNKIPYTGSDIRGDLNTYYTNSGQEAMPENRGPVAVLDNNEATYFALPQMLNSAVEESIDNIGTGSFWWALISLMSGS